MADSATGRPILITGAAGKTGRALIRRLAAGSAATRAFVRRPEQRDAARRLGANEVVDGNLRSREDVATALAGVGAVYHICPNVHPAEIDIGRTLVAAARAAGVRHIVYHSVLHPQVEAMPHHWAKMRVEELLFESGLGYTILQPAPYMQNVLGQWQAIREDGVYQVPYRLDSRVVMVDLEDVAEAAARVLTECGHAGATYELCGPGLLDQRQIAAALGGGLGRTVRARRVPRRQWAEGARAAGLGAYAVETLLAMFRYYESHGLAGTPRVLTDLLGRPPTGFGEFVERMAAAPHAPG